MFRYRDSEVAKKIVEKLKGIDLKIRIMHVCGTHQDTIVRFGLDSLFKQSGIEVRQGPGCPVCVTTTREYEEAITMAKKGNVLATFGDAVRVPGRASSLLDLRAEGCDVRIVYSIEDAVNLAKKTGKNVIFLAVGFETTAPSTAVTLLRDPPENFTVLNCHRYVPPVLHALLEMGDLAIQGLLEPGHVSTIIGLRPYQMLSEKYHIPQVIAGFEPLDVLMGIYMLAQQIKKGEAKVENEYRRSVKPEGNVKALAVLEKVFEPVDLAWRGFPVVKASGMKLKNKFQNYDARKRFEDQLKELENMDFPEPKGCRCNEILRGLVNPQDCQLFARACTPSHPLGPCMVSIEGACQIEYKYGGGPR
ncbi:hydrogenase formation protein HypD [Candidatus Hecatella orcuttiae]|uniref:hydrogenase formation protein HypD n=1 Tax=Candidatus Hecatella orcuttiae TaxID=1935119 RepID=UPI002867C630|nr:hydrogenase formation protein HypD [Candidatus Hecatella orcuttiae]